MAAAALPGAAWACPRRTFQPGPLPGGTGPAGSPRAWSAGSGPLLLQTRAGLVLSPNSSVRAVALSYSQEKEGRTVTLKTHDTVGWGSPQHSDFHCLTGAVTWRWGLGFALPKPPPARSCWAYVGYCVPGSLTVACWRQGSFWICFPGNPTGGSFME